MRYSRNTDQGKQHVITIHIPKTAGTSVHQGLLENGFSPTFLVSKYSWRNLKRKLHHINKPGKHAKGQEVKALVGDQEWENSFTFAFVRNPWDLMVSSYHWWLQKAPKFPSCRQDVETIRQLGSFSAFMDSHYGRKMINEYGGCFFDWLSDGNQGIVVEFVGKLENLENDWSYISKRLDFTQPTLPHTNKSQRRAYQDYYDSKTKKIIEQRFAWAIEHFDYSF